MRPGGEADKLSNRYEGCWTIYNLLGLLRSECLEMCVEPLEDGIGVEFVKVLSNGVREFHSVKIQNTGNAWTLHALSKENKNGRSILGDLFEKLTDTAAQARFISQTGANRLHLLCEDAEASPDLASFHQRMSGDRAADFQAYIVPTCAGDATKALDYLKRTRVVSFSLHEMMKIVERDISRSLYRPDGQQIDPAVVRRTLAEVVLNSLGRSLKKDNLVEILEKDGYYEANWARDRSILEMVKTRNDSYHRSVRGQLINGDMIHRAEADEAFRVITLEADRFGAFVGVAGLGKSCTAAELLELLSDAGIPHVALRFDQPFEVLTPRQLGHALDFPTSPVDVLAGIAEGHLCVLLLDQLDALSIVSGRNQKLWPLVEDLLEEVRTWPKMKVWIACRAFDLENDPRLRDLFAKEKARRIDLRPLTVEEVVVEIRKAKVLPEGLGPHQLELLRTPMHLTLYLQGDPATKPPFKTVQELYDRFWNHKQDLVRARLGRDPIWAPVIDLLCDKLSAEQVLSVPVAFLDDCYRSDARAMASENVLVCENGLYRFFHEGFFDYAFARRFVHRGGHLTTLLLDGEQHLFRRAQVRQVLAYLRGENRARYLVELGSVLKTKGVRPHIVKLVLDWMRALPDPTVEELALLGIT
ncbi:MAG: hypothetical protein C5B50_27030 [Verrucomicrobia bacterium]|nr:MAG: hypothetical protein C5B50_27030 [Verrucomicrobiota bacterium]